MRGPRQRCILGFTLAELLISFGILAFLVILLASLVSGVSRAWSTGEKQVSQFQDGRAILELVGRELSQAAISPALQFVQNPVLPTGVDQRANSDSIFWQGPATITSAGNLSEIGYYLTPNYELKRFFVAPNDTNFAIFTNSPTDATAPWITSHFISANQFSSVCSTVSTGVLAFWVRCIDANGEAIPWLSSNATGVGTLKFNSAAHFQPAILGQTNSFKYTNAGNTIQAHLLPAAVELTITTLDPATFRRNPTIPGLNAPADQNDLPNVRDSFNQQLISNNVQNAHTFTTRVRLLNAAQ